MCGLFGCITKKDFTLTPELAKKRNAVIRGLALAMEKRGNQSTGIAGIGGGFCETYKKPVSAREFVDREPFQKFLNNNYNIIVGHTRLATMGAVAERNAHPFKIGSIVGTHNGQLYNWHNIKPDVEVDSQAIFYQLNQDKNDYVEALGKLYGHFALAWFDVKTPDTLFLAVDGNPLHVMYVHALRTYFYASEHYPLEAIVNTHFNIKKRTRAWATETSKVYKITTKLQISKDPVKFANYSTSSHKPTTYYQPYDSARWQQPDYEEPDDRCNLGNTYEERYGVNNPYKKVTHESDHILLDDIENLKIAEMQIIEKKIERDGCDICQRKFEMVTDEGFYWYGVKCQVLCLDCLSMSTIPFEYVLWVDWDDYSEIVEELDDISAEFV